LPEAEKINILLFSLKENGLFRCRFAELCEETADVCGPFPVKGRHYVFQRRALFAGNQVYCPEKQQEIDQYILPGKQSPVDSAVQLVIEKRTEISNSPAFAGTKQVHQEMQMKKRQIKNETFYFAAGKNGEY